MSIMQKVVENVRDSNPYPADIFTEPDKATIKRAAEVLRENNISPDRIFSWWGRQVWNLCVERFEREIKEAEDDG